MFRIVVMLCLLLLVLPTPDAEAQGFAWAAGLGGGGDDRAYGVAVDDGGNAYTVGIFSATADFDPGPGTYNLSPAGDFDAFVVKLDSQGDFVWAGRLGGTEYDDAGNVTVDADGDVYTVGMFSGTADFDPGTGTHNLTSAGDRDAYLSKLDSAGNFVWARQLGGTGYDAATDVAIDASGNVYTVGHFEGTADFDPGPATFELTSAGLLDAFVSKLDSAGKFVWAGQMGGTSFDLPLELAIDASGNVYTVGYFEGTADFDPGPGTYELTSVGIRDVFISKLDGAGNFVWAGRMGGTSLDSAQGVTVDASGDVYTVGYFLTTADFDPGPGTYYLTSAGSLDAFVSKLDSEGNFVWAKRQGGAGDDRAYGVAVDAGGDVHTVGWFEDTADFDPGTGTYELTSAGVTDAYVSLLDSAGNFVWAGRMGGEADETAWAVAVGASGNIQTVGYFEGTADFDPSPGVYELTPAGVRDGFVLKLSACGYFFDGSVYGRLLFPPLCTRDASDLPCGPGEPCVYNSTTTGVQRGVSDTFYLSSHGTRFRPLVVDEVVHVIGVDSGLGPYDYQPGVPPFVHDTPIENNLAPLPAYDITSLIPLGPSPLLFEFVDTQREIYGHTAVYLVRDCGIYLGAASINWVSHDVDVIGFQSNLDVVSGLISDLRADRGFSRACDLGSFIDTTQAVDQRPDPSQGDGYYYLVNGTCASDIGFGDSSLVPDPRDALVAPSTCGTSSSNTRESMTESIR